MGQSTASVAVSSRSRKPLSKRSSHLALVRTPRGTVIGDIVLEGDQRVFVRRVHERHRLRSHDAWTIGGYVLQQLVRWHLTMIRYLAPDGTYETSLADFLARAIPLEFPGHDESQHVLPRGWWTIRPVQVQERAVQEQLALHAAPEVRT